MATVNLKVRTIDSVMPLPREGAYSYMQMSCSMNDFALRSAFKELLKHMPDADVVEILAECGIEVKEPA